jgi:hypothetical protein
VVSGAEISCGVVVGRAIKEQKEEVFGWIEEELAVEKAPIDWNIILQTGITRK